MNEVEMKKIVDGFKLWNEFKSKMLYTDNFRLPTLDELGKFPRDYTQLIYDAIEGERTPDLYSNSGVVIDFIVSKEEYTFENTPDERLRGQKFRYVLMESCSVNDLDWGMDYGVTVELWFPELGAVDENTGDIVDVEDSIEHDRIMISVPMGTLEYEL